MVTSLLDRLRPSRRRQVFLTVDVEPDCPPFLWTWRGMEEGMPALLQLFAEEGVPATCFVTGDTAEHYPEIVEALVAKGHELGCHGFSHRSFRHFDEVEAFEEITRTNAILRGFAPVDCFRAPYLEFPERFLPLLARDGIRTDVSRAAYKRQGPTNDAVPEIRRLCTSMTSSVLRFPPIVRDPWLLALADPVVLFVHPWEFVDLTRTAIRYDCRFRTGQPALDALRQVIGLFRRAGAEFRLVRDYAAGTDAPRASAA